MQAATQPPCSSMCAISYITLFFSVPFLLDLLRKRTKETSLLMVLPAFAKKDRFAGLSHMLDEASRKEKHLKEEPRSVVESTSSC